MVKATSDEPKGKRAIVLPGTDTAEELADLVARLSFYLAPMDGWTVVIPTSVQDAQRLVTPVSRGGRFRVPDGMDPRIEALHRSISDRIELVDIHDEPAVARHHSDSALVFVRDEAIAKGEPWASLQAASAGKRTYPVDRHRHRMEGSQYIQAVFANSSPNEILIEDSHAKFQQLAKEIGHHSVAYLLATGPSIDRFSDFDLSDGLAVACNTTVLDKELLERARPQILTFADPIFHFGCSLYAAEFRQAVREAARSYDFHIVIPIKYYELYTSLEPALASRIIGLPFAQREINLDLLADFETRVTDNIATFTMLPLATTFATHVAFLGFDGRKPEETYFWRHNPRTQLNHLMDNVKSIHPGFFNLEYQDYYARHCDNLERYVERGEANGNSFYSLRPSAIPALASRERAKSVSVDDLATLLSATKPSFRVVTINPDWVDDFGHYSQYDRRLAEAVKQERGDLISVVNAGLEAGSSGLGTVRCFSEQSWVPTHASSRGDVHLFERELEGLLESYAALDSTTPTAFAMYVSSAWHVTSFVRLRVKFAQLPWTFTPNLFLSHQELLQADLSPTSEPPCSARVLGMTSNLRARLGIKIFADSVRLQRAIHRHTGEAAGLWPMFSTTSIPQGPAVANRVDDLRDHIRVYCPANAQLAKGYDLLPQLARAATPGDRRIWDLVTRSVVRPNTPHTLRQAAEALEKLTVALSGVLSDEEYLEAFRSADVILIPYRFVPFASRTSAVLSDAILLGKPVVATSGTWAGNWVEELGVGVTFQDGDVQDMLRAIRHVCAHIDHYREATEVARSGWAEMHSPVKLAELLRTETLAAGPVDVNHDLRAAVVEMTCAVEAIARSGRQRLPSRVARDDRKSRPKRPPRRLLRIPLRIARRSPRYRQAARRLYRVSPAVIRKRVDELVRSNPG